jgi:hypothetical protein
VSLQLVIASYHENLAWLRGSLPYPHVLMNSGGGARWWETQAITGSSSFHTSGSLPSNPCENIGKEAGQYLQYIIQNYDSLAERTVFMQADFGISVHLAATPSSTLLEILRQALPRIAQHEAPLGSLSRSFSPVSPNVVPFPEGHRVLEAVLDPDKKPAYTLRGETGAQFWVDKSLIRKFPRSYYTQILDMGGLLAHELECWWPAVFQPDVSPETATEESSTD